MLCSVSGHFVLGPGLFVTSTAVSAVILEALQFAEVKSVSGTEECNKRRIVIFVYLMGE